MSDSQAILALEDGTVFHGPSFGAVDMLDHTAVKGEVVFATAMTSYQEIRTDPFYHGQIVVLTYPLIDNYGVSEEDVESRRPWLAALVVADLCEAYSHTMCGCGSAYSLFHLSGYTASCIRHPASQ